MVRVTKTTKVTDEDGNTLELARDPDNPQDRFLIRVSRDFGLEGVREISVTRDLARELASQIQEALRETNHDW